MAGRPLLEWTLEAFQNHPGIDSITLVGGAGDLERLQAAAALFPKVGKVVVGGTTRAESVKNGLDTLPDTTDLVLVHDAARPLVSSAVIDRIIEASRRVGAAVPGLPLSDTVKRADAGGIVRATIPRSISKGAETLAGLTAVQTPQGVRAALLRQAYDRYDYAQGEPTDEASLVEALGEPVQIVLGDPINIKITRQEDLALAEHLGRTRFAAAGAYGLTALPSSEQPAATHPGLDTAAVSSSAASFDMPGDGQGSSLPSSLSSPSKLSSPSSDLAHPEYRTGFGYDVHAFASPESGRKLFLGGIEIPHDRGLEGHSDADVLLHAVCDALLGAASLGDIGILFPNTDDAYKGISSLKLLTVVAQRLHEAGWRVVNVDATVIAEAPRLMPHRIAMQQTMAASLAIDADRVSVKATTAEKLGFVGRREGMEASAIATIVRR